MRATKSGSRATHSRRMAQRVRRRQDDNRAARPPHPPLRHRRGRYGVPVTSNFAFRARRRERNFWMRRRAAKNRHSILRTAAETKIREVSGRKCPQKRPIRRRPYNVKFAETGWWWKQSCETRLRWISGQNTGQKRKKPTKV
jgi:hypothetical protein